MSNESTENAGIVRDAVNTDGAASTSKRAPHITRINVVVVTISILLIAIAAFLTTRLIAVTGQSDDVYARYKACADADTQLVEASDYLTTQVRLFVTTGDRVFMDNYFEELLNTQRRDKAVAVLESEAVGEKAKADLAVALGESNELALAEEYAMRLVAEAEGITDLPEPIERTPLSQEDKGLSPVQKRELATSLVIGDSYDMTKASISQDVERSSTALVKALDQEQLDIERQTGLLLTALIAVGLLLLVTVVIGGVATYQLVTRPMKIHAENIAQARHLDPLGCFEIRRVVDAYNALYDRVQERTERIKHEAEIDALTDLFNRGSFDRIMSSRKGDFALVLTDIDHFKDINDQYGHEVGDEVIRVVAGVVESHFRSSDFVCRLGGDEFAIILPNTTVANRGSIEAKLAEIARALDGVEGDLPKVTLSFGVAFSNDGAEDIYNDADKALYESKRGGRNRTTFFEG